MSEITKPIHLQIGDTISVYDEVQYSSEWRGAVVSDINESKIKVRFRHFPHSAHQWIDTETTAIDTGKSSIEYVDCEIFGRDCIPPDPCYYNKQIIISIDGHDSTDPGIYSYDIENDKCTKITTYPNDLSLDRHGMAVDTKNHDIYLFGGRSKVFGVYNVLNKRWKTETNDNMPDIRYPSSIYIASPFDELYFMGIKEDDVNNSRLSIFKYCKKEKDSLIDIMSNFHFADKLKYSDMIYDEERQRIMLFGGSSDYNYGDTIYFDDIWVYDVSQNEKNKQWEVLPVKLPHRYSSSIKAIYAFGSVVFVLYLDDEYKAIWCLELLSNKWFKSHLNLPREVQGDIVKINDNYIHCMYYDNDGAYHLKMDLQDMIPTDLYRFYSNYYRPLINGYIRINIEQIYEYHVSNDLKQLISEFWNALL